MPSTTRGGDVGVSRTVPLWQTAQFSPTWSMPMRWRRETPIGQLVAGLDDEAERRVAAADPVAADRRQRAEHPVGRQHAADRPEQRDAGLAADRAVLEVLLDVGEANRPIAVSVSASQSAISEAERDEHRKRPAHGRTCEEADGRGRSLRRDNG